MFFDILHQIFKKNPNFPLKNAIPCSMLYMIKITYYKIKGIKNGEMSSNDIDKK